MDALHRCLQCFKLVPTILSRKPFHSTPIAFDIIGLTMELWVDRTVLPPLVGMLSDPEHNHLPRELFALAWPGHDAVVGEGKVERLLLGASCCKLCRIQKGVALWRRPLLSIIT